MEYLKAVRSHVNKSCSHLEPCDLILCTALTIFLMVWLKEQLSNMYVRRPRLRRIFFEWLPYVPCMKKYVEEAKKKLDDVSREVEAQVSKGVRDRVVIQRLPTQGWDPEKIKKTLDSYLGYGSFKWDEGYVSGAVYHANDPKLKPLMADIFAKTAYQNPLHPDLFPGIRMMEAEVIRITCSLLNGDEGTCGTVTSGGTESIFLACKSYRDYALYEKGIKHPVMVIPITAHAAFSKAANVLKMQVKLIPVDPDTSKVNMIAMKRAVTKNTCMLVGSAPAFPHGSIDPIQDIARLGVKYKIPVHVDACLGGFLVPFMRSAGYAIPEYDFSVEGVTSISIDTHKYAYAPKGSSVVVYRNKSYRHYQYFVEPDWPGGIYGTPSLPGSRPGASVACCWAALLYHGQEFYIEATRKIISVAKYIEKGLREIPEIYILGKPEVSVIAVGSKHFDIFRLSGALMERGWNLNVLQYPSGFHFCVTMQHTIEVADKFLHDVQECTAEVMMTPDAPAEGSAAIYGMAQQIPDRSIVSELVWTFLDACTNS